MSDIINASKHEAIKPAMVALEPQAESLEDVLMELARHGRPRTSLLSNGWNTTIDMHIASIGSEFSVRSEFDLPTPLMAAKQCRERMHAALRQSGQTKDQKAGAA